MKEYYSFVYLDIDSIDNLYPQVFGDIIERNVITSNEESIDESINAKIFNILGANANNKQNSISSENLKFATSTARKAQLLINFFKTDITSIQDIIENVQATNENESFYFVGNGTFFLSDIYDSQTGVSLFPTHETCENNIQHININNDSVLIMESGNTNFISKYCSECIDLDDYYKINLSNNLKYGIIMHMSNKKIKKDIRHLTYKIKKAKDFEFYVFGELTKASNRFYQISPFAIWR